MFAIRTSSSSAWFSSSTLERRFNPEEDFETEKKRLLDLLDRMRQRGIRLEVETLQEILSSGVAWTDPARPGPGKNPSKP